MNHADLMYMANSSYNMISQGLIERIEICNETIEDCLKSHTLLFNEV